MMKRLRRIHSKRRGKQRTLPCLVCKSEDQAARDVLQSVPCRQQRVVVPPEVPQDMRNSVEDMEISQLQVKREVRKVQGVSLDTDKRELQRWARNSVEYSVRDKQVEASDALINEVGALLTESGGAQIIEIFRLEFGMEAWVWQVIFARTNRMDHMKVSLGISARTAT